MPPAYHSTAEFTSAPTGAASTGRSSLSAWAHRNWRLPSAAKIFLFVLIALAPVTYMIGRAWQASSNVVYWDEFDTALAFVLRLDHGVTGPQFLDELFAMDNEHRMVTSRIMYAVNYWLTGTVNFAAIGIIGNACLLTFCGLLIAQAGTATRRVRLAVLLSLLLFNLAHYENFFWSGSSIDHFQVVLLAGGALLALSRNTRIAWLGAGLAALLATFTLAHGMLVWPIGAALLWRSRRWDRLAGWSALALVACGVFFAGFEANPGHQVGVLSFDRVDDILHYWLALIGAPVALGQMALAPWLGAALLGLFGWLLAQGAARRESVAFHLTLYVLLALALIAFGRAAVANGVVYSRYLVLGSLAWALVFFMLLERVSSAQRPLFWLAWSLPLLAGFNLAADFSFANDAETWVECRDRATARFKQHGSDGRGPFTLSPLPMRSTELLREASKRGIYFLPRVSNRRDFSAPSPTNRITYFVDEMTADTHGIFISGWAAIPGATSKRGQIHLVLRSAKNFIVYTTMTDRRPDVVKAYSDARWQLSGFQFAVGRWRLPPEELQVGILITDGDHSEYVMTEHRLRPFGRGEALMATGQ